MFRIHKGRLAYAKLAAVISSKGFRYFLIGLVVAQGMWFALSYQPNIYDERYHFLFSEFYTERISPIVTEQSTEWDRLGAVSRNPNYLFYYLVSLPLRIIQLFTDSYFVQVLLLRMVFLGIFVAGIVAYRKLLLRLGATQALANLSLLLLMLTPVAATFSAVITYDIVVFTLLPIILLLLLDILESKNVDAYKLSRVASLALFAGLMKFSFIPFMAPILIYLLFDIWKRRKQNAWHQIKRSYGKLGTAMKIGTIVLPLILLGLMAERSLVNVIKYRNFTVPCTKILSEERCMANYTAVRTITFTRDKPSNFKPLTPPDYLMTLWLQGMAKTGFRVMNTSSIFPVLKVVSYMAAFGGLFILLLYLRDFMKDRSTRVVLVISGVYLTALFAEQYMAYLRLGQPAAISARYLLPVLPLFVFLVLEGMKRAAGKKYPALLSLAAVAVVLFMTQGGGITSHLMTVPLPQWEDGIVPEKVNPVLEDIADNLVIGAEPRQR